MDPFEMELTKSSLLLLGFILLFVMLLGYESPMAGSFGLTAPFFALALLIAPAATLGSLRGEAESGALDHLRCTPLTSREILSGKLLGILWRPSSKLFFLSTICVLLFPLVFFVKLGLGSVSILLFYPTLAVVILLAATAGLLGAALSRSTLQAVVLSYAIVLGPLFVFPLFWGPMRLLSAAISPVIGFYATVDRYFEAGRHLHPAILLSLPGGLALAALQYFLAVAVFEKRWLRDR